MGIILLLILCSGWACAEDDLQYQIGCTGTTNYIWRGICLSDKPVVQPTVTCEYRNLGLNLWGNWDTGTDEYNETDLTLYGWVDLKRWSLEAGYIHYDIKNGLDTDEFYISAAADVLLQPEVKLFVDITEGTGAFMTAGVSHPLPLPRDCSILFEALASAIFDTNTTAVDESGKEFTSLFHSEFTLSAILPLNPHFEVKPYTGYTVPISSKAKQAILSSSADSSEDHFYGGLALTVSF